MKIYSINEIVKATNNILNPEPEFLNKNNKKILLEGSIPKEIEGIILEAENSQIKNRINNPIKKINQQNEDDEEEFKVSKDELIESMHKTFSKKIKKNTLKLILDLREEIIILTKNISLLKKKKKEEEFNKKMLKKNVVDLKQTENELKYTLNQIQTGFDLLKEQNKNLSLDHDSLKEKYKNLSLDYDLLKEQNKNLNTKNILLQSDFLKLRKISIELRNQAIILKNNNIKINSQLTEYKNKDLVSKSKIEKLEKEIATNSNLLSEANNKEINKYKEEESELREKNQYLKKTIDELKLKTNNNVENSDISELKDKIRHYQDENIRISNELVESNKRFDITKESLSELQGHRSHLIEKINSINEVIKNENVVTSAFGNSLEDNEINIIDSRKPTKKDKIDLNKEITKIFSNK
jgi:chromosome segregation ATPase